MRSSDWAGAQSELIFDFNLRENEGEFGFSELVPSRVREQISKISAIDDAAASQKRAPMMNGQKCAAREIVFIDRGIDDLDTLLKGLRPEVEVIVLDPAKSAVAQMAEAVRGRRDELDAIHVIAHGRPGEVNFASGTLSLETLGQHATDLAAIGRTLRNGEIRLWTCETAHGVRGAVFVDALVQATGAAVAAATGRVGAAKLGGVWELTARSSLGAAYSPLTAAGIAGYAGVFSVTLTSRGKGERLRIFGRWPAGTKAGTYFIVWNNRGTLEVLGKFIVPVDTAGTFAISEPLTAGIYTVGPTTAGPGTIAVYNGRWKKGGQAAGTWSVSDFNPTITATLNDTRNIISNNPSLSGVVL